MGLPNPPLPGGFVRVKLALLLIVILLFLRMVSDVKAKEWRGIVEIGHANWPRILRNALNSSCKFGFKIGFFLVATASRIRSAKSMQGCCPRILLTVFAIAGTSNLIGVDPPRPPWFPST
jgi:hypothetical protein